LSVGKGVEVTTSGILGPASAGSGISKQSIISEEAFEKFKILENS
jgi:hypothetical protein